MRAYSFAIIFLFHTVIGHSQPTYAIKNITVIPMDREGSFPDRHVIVIDGIITDIGSKEKVKIPGAATVIDGSGKYLIPGLFDMRRAFFLRAG